jgi:hypothetical protein
LLQAALVMAAHIEQVALAADYEPLYHNRLHTADALTAICLLIQALQKKNIVVDDEWAAAFLFAVTSHDVLHPGGANSFLQEIERRSAKEMQYIATPLGIDVVWLHRVRELILRTDPALVTGNHDKVQGVAFEMNLDWACVLINEADILASATSRYGPALGHALANEWAFKNHPLHQVVGTAKGRLQFLSSLRFSSPPLRLFKWLVMSRGKLRHCAKLRYRPAIRKAGDARSSSSLERWLIRPPHPRKRCFANTPKPNGHERSGDKLVPPSQKVD